MVKERFSIGISTKRRTEKNPPVNVVLNSKEKLVYGRVMKIEGWQGTKFLRDKNTVSQIVATLKLIVTPLTVIFKLSPVYVPA